MMSHSASLYFPNFILAIARAYIGGILCVRRIDGAYPAIGANMLVTANPTISQPPRYVSPAAGRNMPINEVMQSALKSARAAPSRPWLALSKTHPTVNADQ